MVGVEDVLIRSPIVRNLPDKFRRRLIYNTQLFPYLKAVAGKKKEKEEDNKGAYKERRIFSIEITRNGQVFLYSRSASTLPI